MIFSRPISRNEAYPTSTECYLHSARDRRAGASLLLRLALWKLHACFTFLQCVLSHYCSAENHPDAASTKHAPNEITRKMWEAFQKSVRSKRWNPAPIFRRVEDGGTLKPAEIANDKQDIANAFDKIIQLESGKIRNAEGH